MPRRAGGPGGVCYKQCPGGGWIAAAGACRAATAAQSAHPCWGYTPQTVEFGLLGPSTALPGDPQRRFYAPVSLAAGADGARRDHIDWERAYVRDQYRRRLGGEWPESVWGGGDGVAANDEWPVWEFSASYDFAQPALSGDMRRAPRGWLASAAGRASDPAYRNGRSFTCGTVDWRPAGIALSVTGGSFGCKHVAATLGAPDPVTGDQAVTAVSPTSTTDTGLSSLTFLRSSGAGALRPACRGTAVAIPDGGRSGFFTVTTAVTWQVRVRMSASTGWTAPAGRAADGPCGSSARCGELATVVNRWTASGGNRLAPGI